MLVQNEPDFTWSSEACLAATGRTIDDWYAYLDTHDGLKNGRREGVYGMMTESGVKMTVESAWWFTTLYVEYEKARDVRKKDGLFEGYSICCTKNITAPVAKVYSTWTDPAQFAEMFGDNGQQNLVDGGSLSCNAGCEGTFTRIRPDKDLRFTWRHPGCTTEMTVDVQFQDMKGKTTMNVMTSRIQSRPEADGLRRAWSEVLNRLKSAAER